jgi:NAD+ kinase
MKKQPLRIALVVNKGKTLAARLVPRIERWLRSEGQRPFVFPDTATGRRRKPALHLPDDVDLVVAFGGDGTLLRAARLVGERDIPVMGVNLGGLGFLTEFSAEEARAGLAAFCRGAHVEERRIVLACACDLRRGFALNDVAVNMGPDNRVIDLTASSGGLLVTRFVGDGVVVATPTGSTAYSLAAGGPVVFPTMDAILLTPLSPHALGSRPLILPGDACVELTLSSRSESAVLSLDGQERWKVRPDTPVRISRAPHAFRLVTPRNKTYFQILRDKLKWTGSQR